MKTTFYCTATIEYFDRREGDYVKIDLDHYSKSISVEEAEYDAREVWSEHGYNPETVNVSAY